MQIDFLIFTLPGCVLSALFVISSPGKSCKFGKSIVGRNVSFVARACGLSCRARAALNPAPKSSEAGPHK